MKLLITFVMASILAGAVWLAAFSAERLQGNEISNFISGKKVVLSTSYGKFPMLYAANKKVTGDGTGTGLGRFFNTKETGRWWIDNDKLCQKFPTWYKGRTFCFTLEKTGARSLRWKRDDGYTGTATVSG